MAFPSLAASLAVVAIGCWESFVYNVRNVVSGNAGSLPTSISFHLYSNPSGPVKTLLEDLRRVREEIERNKQHKQQAVSFYQVLQRGGLTANGHPVTNVRPSSLRI